MQFQDLRAIPKIDWPKASWKEVYDPKELEFRIEPSGKAIEKKVRKAIEDAAKQQLDESKRTLKVKTKLTYEKGWAVLMRVPRKIAFPIESLASDVLPNTYIASSIGKRRTQEDAYVADRFEVLGCLLEVTCVFDGHGNEVCSLFMKAKIVSRLQQLITDFCPDGLTGSGIWNALKLVTVYLSREYTSLYGGTCSNICLLFNKTLFVANLGDSRAILIEKERKVALQLSKDQKATDPQYKRSIEKRNGTIKDERLDGFLLPARSVGDHGAVDSAGFATGTPSICSRGKIVLFDLEPGTNYILLQACDGIFDYMTTDQVSNFMLTRQESLADRTHNLVAAAIEDFKSEDNVTVITRELQIG